MKRHRGTGEKWEGKNDGKKKQQRNVSPSFEKALFDPKVAI